MKKIYVLIPLLLTSAVLYAQESVKCETDNTQNATLCKTESIKLSITSSDVKRATLHLVYIFEIDSYLLVPSFTSNRWQYSNTEWAYFQIDGETAEYRLQQVDSRKNNKTVIEQYYIQLQTADAERLYQAEKVRFRLDNDTYTLSANAKNKLKQLAETVNKMQQSIF